MKIIDLLNKIAKGELEDKTKVKFGSEIYEFWEEDKKIHGRSSITYDFQKNITRNLDWDKLDDEVEIIEEEKEIENLPFDNEMSLTMMEMYHQLEKYNYKINELIDVINDMRDKE